MKYVSFAFICILAVSCRARVFNENSLNIKSKNLLSDEVVNDSAKDSGFTTIRLCNNSEAEIVQGAIAFEHLWKADGRKTPPLNPVIQVEVQGWIDVPKDECKIVTISSVPKYTGNLYVYGKYKDKKWGGGDSSFCISDKEEFTLMDSLSKSCNSEESRVKFSDAVLISYSKENYYYFR